MKKIYRALDGVLLVDKPAGPTSHHIVAQIKRILSPERIGHLGTLDPFASGLLPIMLGGATKLADEAMESSKGYLFRISLGTETDTLDPSGRVVQSSQIKVDCAETVQSVLGQFTGTIRQVPPAYSALKKDGRPLYEYMRAEGKLPFDLEEKARMATIYELSLKAFDTQEQTADLEVICAKGTYVRSLARDIAHALGTVGHCSALRRHIVGNWNANQSSVVPGGQLGELDLEGWMLPPHHIAEHLTRFHCEDTDIHRRLLSGNQIVINDFASIWTTKLSTKISLDQYLQSLPCQNPDGKCLFETVHGLQYLAEYSIVDNTFVLRPRKKTQSPKSELGD